MRVALTIDDDLAARLTAEARRTGFMAERPMNVVPREDPGVPQSEPANILSRMLGRQAE
jgi:hypothetical protein